MSRDQPMQAVFTCGTHHGKPRCQTWRRGDEWTFRKNQCDHVAKYADDTKCGRHDPDRLAARIAKRGPTMYERKIAASKKTRDELAELVAAAREACEYLLDGSRRLKKALEPFK